MRTIIFGLIMFALGFAYGKEEWGLWEKTVEFFKMVVEKIKELIEKWKNK